MSARCTCGWLLVSPEVISETWRSKIRICYYVVKFQRRCGKIQIT